MIGQGKGNDFHVREQEHPMTSEAGDFLLIDEMLTEEERMVRDTVRNFVDERVMPTIADDFEQAEAPMHLVREMGEMGIIGATLPEKYGCSGIDFLIFKPFGYNDILLLVRSAFQYSLKLRKAS